MKRSRKQWIIDTILLVLTVFVLYLYVIFNNPQSVNHIVRIGLDDIIPRIPIFAIPYLIFLPWLYGTLIYSWFKNRYFQQLAYSFIVINLIAYFVYLVFQTVVSREVIASHDIFSNILQFIYNSDLPYAGFPSLHSALSASIATYFIATRSKYSWMAVSMAGLIVISTLFTKQHFVLDALAGVILGVASTTLIFRLMTKNNN